MNYFVFRLRSHRAVRNSELFAIIRYCHPIVPNSESLNGWLGNVIYLFSEFRIAAPTGNRACSIFFSVYPPVWMMQLQICAYFSHVWHGQVLNFPSCKSLSFSFILSMPIECKLKIRVFSSEPKKSQSYSIANTNHIDHNGLLTRIPTKREPVTRICLWSFQIVHSDVTRCI